jgi:putative Holliday junction resolvase
MNQISRSILGLDIGSKRIGIAKAFWPDGLPSPLTTLANDGNFLANLQHIIQTENVKILVVGRPRGLDSKDTQQTKYTSSFVQEFNKSLKLPIYWIDEAVTSIQAENELRLSKKAYSVEDIDSLSATYILEDFMNSQSGEINVEN